MLETHAPKRKFTVKIYDVSNVTPGKVVTIFASTASEAMTTFLRDYVKNNRIAVEVLERNQLV